jgi:N-formylglutamate amidohydrolase
MKNLAFETFNQLDLFDDYMFNKENIIFNFFSNHNKLTKLVEDKLNKFGEALIIDSHSFSNDSLDYPDICLGTDEYHTPPNLINRISDFFKKEGYLVKINYPFSGTIVPLKYLNKNKNVNSILIEINKNVYLNDVNKINKLNNIINDLINNKIN